MSNIKQLRLRIIEGVDQEGALSYSEGFDLMNIIDIQYLKNLCKKCIIEGFSIETSTFNKGEYNNQCRENEFQPFVECLHAKKLKNGFSFHNELFAKMKYHIIRDSILDINHSDMLLLLASIIPGDIEETLNGIKEEFELGNYGKKPKIVCFK